MNTPALEEIVFHSDFDDFSAWKQALETNQPDIRLVRPEYVSDPAKVRYALVWKPPQGFFARYPDLALVINLGAGVDSLVGRGDLPCVPITRLSDPNMARMMGGYVLFAVLRHARDIPVFEAAQREGKWRYLHPREPESQRVGILGLGELGAHAASELVRQGFDVRGWSRSPKALAGVRCSHGMDSLPAFLAECDILVVMLPLTPDTRHLLDARRLGCLPAGASLVNVSRGAVVDEAALLDALRTGHLGHATLDVFENEPLAPGHPLWSLPNVLITPHLASIALPGSAAPQIAANIRRIRSGAAVQHQVDPVRGY